MKILVAILSLLISVSAFSHEGFKVRDRYTDEHGVPYGAQNPPVHAGNTGAHCMYSAWGCSGAGGSTDIRGRSFRHPMSNPFTWTPYGPGAWGGGVWGAGGCGSTVTTTGGGASAGNGWSSGSIGMQQSRVVCTPNGVSHQSRGGSIGIVNGNIGGSVNFGGTTITNP